MARRNKNDPNDDPFAQQPDDNPFRALHSASFRLDLDNSNELPLLPQQQQQLQQRHRHRDPLNQDPHPHPENNRDRDHCCSARTMRTVVRAWLFLDGLLGLTLLFMNVLLLLLLTRRNHHHHHDQCSSSNVACELLRVLPIGLPAVLLTRALVGVAGVAWDGCQRCGLLLSAQASAVQAIVNAILAVLCVVEQDVLREWLQQKQPANQGFLLLLPPALVHWLVHHVHWIAVAFGVAAVIECARWQLLHQYQRRLLQRDHDDLLRVSPELTSTPGRHRPWWWKRSFTDHDDDRPLMMGTPEWAVLPFEETPAAQQSSWWFRLPWRRWRSEDASVNARDNGSVDFASVQSEWASRDEEDPYWWSREEEDGHSFGGNNNHNNKRSDDNHFLETVSWLTPGNHDKKSSEATTVTSAATRVDNKSRPNGKAAKRPSL